jgi:hypothetical protein
MENLQCVQTGDINLAAAIMSCGLPLSPVEPVRLIENQRDGAKYARFTIEPFSMDGKTIADDLINHWVGRAKLPESHGFAQICAFLEERPHHIKRTPDLLDFAIDYLCSMGMEPHGIRTIRDVADYVNTHESMASYILAFVSNRDLCHALFINASHQRYYEAGEGDERRRALLSTALPRRAASELLARLNG